MMVNLLKNTLTIQSIFNIFSFLYKNYMECYFCLPTLELNVLCLVFIVYNYFYIINIELKVT